VAIARAAGAKLYAEQALTKAEGYLQEAEVKTAAKKNRIMNAREAVQRAEDSRLIAIKHQEAEQVELTAKANQERVDAAKRSADLAAAGEARAKEQTRVAAVQTQAAEQESANLRSRLMSQLNAVLETRATARGLIVNMSGMLFQPGKATLEPAAREKLAKIAGILSTHKGLIIEADGFTDNTGGDALNQRLSEQRADASRDFLVSQGVASDAIMAKGFGKSNPIAPNDTSKGRKANRRVELVVSGNGVTSYVSSR
jgi:outer membrane protein OmpA-like peptidoglycan-associated protein